MADPEDGERDEKRELPRAGPREVIEEIVRFIEGHVSSLEELEVMLLLRVTAPRAWCERAELMDVGMMAASEVATAMCMRHSSGTPANRRKYSSTGTVTMPPPTPSSPATNPATTPETARMATSGSRSSITRRSR